MERRIAAITMAVFASTGLLNAQDMPLLSRYYWSHWDTVRNVAVDGNFAFAAVSHAGLTVLNIEDIENPAVVAAVDFPGSALDVELTDELAFVRTPTSIEIIDRRDLQNLNLFGTIEGTFDDMEIVGDILFTSRLRYWEIPGPGGPTQHWTGSHYGYDISDPALPERFWEQSPEMGPHSLTLLVRYGDFLYVSGGYSLIYDISNPLQPVQRGRTDVIGYQARGYAISDTILFTACFEGYIDIVSLADPLVPRRICWDYFGDGANFYHAAVSGETLYLWGNWNRRNQILIFDVADPREHPLVDSLAVESNFLRVEEERLYTGSGLNLQIHDLSEPQQPNLLTTFNDEASVLDVNAAGEFAYITVRGKGLQVLDFGDPESPHIVAEVEFESPVVQAELHGDLLMVLCDTLLAMIDVTRPDSPEIQSIIGVAESGFARSFTLVDTLAYVLEGIQNFIGAISVYNVSDPAEPSFLNRTVYGRQGEPGRWHSIGHQQDFLVVKGSGHRYTPTKLITFLSLNNPGTPEVVFSDAGGHYAVAFGDTTMVTLSNRYGPQGQGPFNYWMLWNVADLLHPGIICESSWDNPVADIAYLRGQQVLALGSEITVLDYDQNSFRRTFQTPAVGVPRSVAFSGEIALIAAKTHLAIYDVSEVLEVEQQVATQPTAFDLTAFPNPFNGTTRIDYNLTGRAEVKLTISTADGRLVETIFQGVGESGANSVLWKAGAYPAGLYVCHLSAGGMERSVKLVMTK